MPNASCTSGDRTLLSIADSGERLGGQSRNTIYRLIAKGELHPVKVGRRTVLHAAEVDSLAARLAIAAGVDPTILVGSDQ